MNMNDNKRFHHPEFYPIDELKSRHFSANIDNVSFIILHCLIVIA